MRKKFAALAAAACLSACTPVTKNEAGKEPPKSYALHGEVVRVDPQAKTATINGNKIEGWMEAMSMEYPVKNAQDLPALHPGECIDATVLVQGADYWISNVKPAEAAPGTCVAKK